MRDQHILAKGTNPNTYVSLFPVSKERFMCLVLRPGPVCGEEFRGSVVEWAIGPQCSSTLECLNTKIVLSLVGKRNCRASGKATFSGKRAGMPVTRNDD